MIKKLCPICDMEMKTSHFCKTCRSWVRKPIVTNITYHLNESHARDEQDCSYHQSAGLSEVMKSVRQAASKSSPARQAASGSSAARQAASKSSPARQAVSGSSAARQAASGSSAARQAALGSSAARQAASQSSPARQAASQSSAARQAAPGSSAAQQAASQSSPVRQTPSRSTAAGPAVSMPPGRAGHRPLPVNPQPNVHKTKPKKRISLPILIVVLYFLFQFSTPLLRNLNIGSRKAIEAFKVEDVTREARSEYEDYEEYDEYAQLYYRELPISELSSNNYCSMSRHFWLTGEALDLEVRQLFEDYQLKIEETETSSYNWEYEDGNTWFSLSTLHVLPEGYINIDCDSGTNKLHGVDGMLTDTTEAIRFTLDLLQIFEASGDAEGSFEESGITEAAITEAISEQEYFAAEHGDILVIVRMYEGECYFGIY